MNDKSEKEDLKKRFGLPLVLWGAINMVLGILFLIPTSDLIKGVLLQSIFWGLIDGFLGLGIFLFKKDFNLKKIKKILLINIYLDVGYVVIGLLLIFLGGNAFLVGNGLGVIIQGIFLFFIDLIHYRHITLNLIG